MERSKMRRISCTAEKQEKERVRGKMRRVAKCAKKAGLPCVLQAVEIHDLYKENNNFIAPLKLPDMCKGDLFYPPDTDDKVWTEQEKHNWFMTKLTNSNAYRDGCRHYLSGFLYNKLDESKWFVVEYGNLVINAKMQQADGSMKEEETQVKVFDLPSLLCDTHNSIFRLGEALSKCNPHVQSNVGDRGAMFGFGQRVDRHGKLGKYAPLVYDMTTNPKKRTGRL
jgi:hypothetical protein